MHNTSITKRIICPKCEYPQSTCLCAWIQPIDSPLNIIVLQHPKEAGHAKNTVKLLKLGLSNIQIIQGEHPDDWSDFSNQVIRNPDNYGICYPHDVSQPIESLITESDKKEAFPSEHNVIFIDASWRKALKIWRLNPWLHTCASWHFSNPPNNQYYIRQTTKKNSLSTLESIAYLLEYTQNKDCTGLRRLFEKMQQICFKSPAISN